MKKFLLENKFIFVAIFITIILVITSFCVNFIRQKNIKDISVDSTKVKYSLPKKYECVYGDLESERAELDITNAGDYINVSISWVATAVGGYYWDFKCQYSEPSNSLVCDYGEETETYPTVNGERVDNWWEYEEKGYELQEGKKIVKNLKATFYIIEGNLKETFEKIGPYKITSINDYEDIIIRTSFPDLKDCIFAKSKGYDTTNLQ